MNTIRRFAWQVAFLAFTIAVNAGDAAGADNVAVDFLVTSYFKEPEDTSQHFVSRIMDDDAIAEARAQLNRTNKFRIIAGEISKTPADWNPGWSYHLRPDTVHFGDFFIEVCDASATYVEENLAAVGGAFLPGNIWCPWGTRVLEELQEVPGYYAPTMALTTLNSGSDTTINKMDYSSSLSVPILLTALAGSFWLILL